MSTARSCSSARERISGFCKADVSGKGVPAALFMMLCIKYNDV